MANYQTITFEEALALRNKGTNTDKYWVTKDLYGKTIGGWGYEGADKAYNSLIDYQKKNNLSNQQLVEYSNQIDAGYSAAFDAHNAARAEGKARLAADKAGETKAQEDVATAAAREAEDKRRRAAGGGIGSTVLTSPLGLPPQPQNVKRKTLLGQ